MIDPASLPLPEHQPEDQPQDMSERTAGSGNPLGGDRPGADLPWTDRLGGDRPRQGVPGTDLSWGDRPRQDIGGDLRGGGPLQEATGEAPGAGPLQEAIGEVPGAGPEDALQDDAGDAPRDGDGCGGWAQGGDRTAAMLELAVRGLSFGRLILLWLAGGIAVVGWAAVGLAIQGFEAGGLDSAAGLVALALGGVLLLTAAIITGFWLSRGSAIRRRLEDWAELGAEPVRDIRLRQQRRCVGWLLPHAGWCLVGVWIAGRAVNPPESVTVGDLIYTLGLAFAILVTSVTGIVQAVAHQRWSGKLLNAVPVRRGGGAHR